MKKTLTITYKIFLHAFALVGFVLVGGFFAVRFHLTDVKGAVDSRSDAYGKVLGVSITSKNDVSGKPSLDQLSQQIENLSKTKEIRQKNLCSIDAIGKVAPINAWNILDAYNKTGSDIIASKMIFAAAVRLREALRAGEVDACEKNYAKTEISDYEKLQQKYKDKSGQNIFPWMNDQEWKTIEAAIIKDKDKINQAAAVANIEPRLIVASAIVEQVRLFHSQRELFKKFFEPLKILGNSNKISLGVMGVKEQTAIDTENHLKDPSSPYYLGANMEHILDFATEDVAIERYKRLTTEGDYYYSYLYGGIYMKQMMNQWKSAGYDISYRPEIVGTLFNVGFPQSKPNANPKVGGSEITIGDAKYSFGSLAYEFYYSGQLLDEFPFVLN
jgi:hypothetical protein